MESVVIKEQCGNKPRHYTVWELRRWFDWEPWELWKEERFIARGNTMYCGQSFSKESYVVGTLSRKASKEEAIKWAKRLV